MHCGILFIILEVKKEEEEEGEEEEEEGEEDENVNEPKNAKLHAMVTVFHFIMKQSYVCALIAMMVCSEYEKLKYKYATIHLGTGIIL